MAKISSDLGQPGANELLRVADYLRKPQRFMPVADARKGMRQTLEAVTKGSVVITTHGEPQAAIVDFETFEAVRGAVMRLLLAEMETSLARAQEAVRKQPEMMVLPDDEELETLVGAAIRKARRNSKKTVRRKPPK